MAIRQPEYAIRCSFCKAGAGVPCQGIYDDGREPYTRNVHVRRATDFQKAPSLLRKVAMIVYGTPQSDP